MNDLAVIPSWFDTPEKIRTLRREAESWNGTPFFAHSQARGRDGGVDCVRLLRSVYTALGVIAPGLTIPRFPMDWGQHQTRSILIEAFSTWPELTGRFVRLPANTPHLPGDALCFNGGKTPHHGGIMLDRGEFVHALKPEGVHMVQLNSEFRGWRIIGQLEVSFRPIPA